MRCSTGQLSAGSASGAAGSASAHQYTIRSPSAPSTSYHQQGCTYSASQMNPVGIRLRCQALQSFRASTSALWSHASGIVVVTSGWHARQHGSLMQAGYWPMSTHPLEAVGGQWHGQQARWKQAASYSTGPRRIVSMSASPSPSQSNSAGGAAAAVPASASSASTAPAAAAKRATYTPLHYNIEEFVQRIVPSEGERRIKSEIVEDLKLCVRKAFPTLRGVDVQVFGSFANGLSCWNSDLDCVVTGLMEPDRHLGGYEPADRAKVTARLRRIADNFRHARKMDVSRVQFIPRARMPILKIWTRSRVCVDISISDDTGPRAARYMAQEARKFAPLRPLVLVLKAFLKSQRLNEVNSGGLSSYSLTNMVVAHLQEELASGNDIYDLGETLYTFLLRYGEEFNYEHEAVSVASGGIVPKTSLGFAMESARQAALSMDSYSGAVGWQERLCVDCPLTGRDVSNGTYRIDLVRGAWVGAARKLEALAKGRRYDDASLNYLQALFDVARVLRRTTPTDPYEDEYYAVQTVEDEGSEDFMVAGETESDVSDALHRTPTTPPNPGPRGKGMKGR